VQGFECAKFLRRNGFSSQERVMTSRLSRLPGRFPVGTKFIIESRPARDGQAQVFSRHLEFPDGTFFPLPPRTQRKPTRIRRRLRARGA
jgi:hypothetical protein